MISPSSPQQKNTLMGLRPIAFGLLGTVLVIVGLLFLQMWAHVFAPDLFAKLLVSTLLVSVVLCYLLGMVLDLPTHKLRWPVLALGGFVSLGAVFSLVFIWTEWLETDLYFKLLASLFLLAIVCVAVLSIREGILTQKSLRDEGYLD